MRKITITAITLFFFSITLAPIARAEVADRIVAIVNDDIITLSEVNEEGAPYFQELIKRAPSEQLPAEMQKLRQEILSHLIDQRLIEQQAAKFEIKVSDEEINQTIDSMLAENHATKEDMKRDLASKGLSEAQYKKQLKNQILQSRLIGREVRSKVVITDEKINEYYKEHYTAKAGASGYHLLQIGFLWGDKYKQKSAAEARQAAENARKQLAAGENFAAVASALSDLPSKEDGGDIGVFEKQELAAHMKDAVLSLKPGETSDIIETPDSYQIIKLVSIQDGSELSGPPMIEVKKEIETKLYQEEGEKLFKKWLSDLRGQAFIKQNL
ncbi:MAG: SurA N-terminal domain-containing protein [Desulfobulbaceae bacterium]|nr:SurA N-terminal domain-containing protein [Desulfobulbaceae bacterium]